MKGPLLQEIWDEFPEERKQKIKDRAEELGVEYLTLQDLRKARERAQERIVSRQSGSRGEVYS